MKFSILIWRVLLISGLGLSSHLSYAETLDLMEAYTLARAHDPTFRAALFTLRAAENRPQQAFGVLLPAVNISGEAGEQRGSNQLNERVYDGRKIRSNNWSLQLTQPLIHFDRMAAYNGALAQLASAKVQFAYSEMQLRLKLAEAYFDVLSAEDSLKASESQWQATREQLDVVKQGFVRGNNTKTEIDEAKARLDLSEATRLQSQAELEGKRDELEKMIGQPVTSLAHLIHDTDLPRPQPQTFNTWVQQAQELNLQVAVRRYAVETARYTVKQAYAQYAPTLDLTASYGNTYGSGSISTAPPDYPSRSRLAQVGLRLNIPIYNGGVTGARVKEMIANLEKAEVDLDGARLQAGNEAKQAFRGFDSGLARVTALRSAVKSGESSLKGVQVAFQVGTRINVDVLNALQQLGTTRRDLSKALYGALLQAMKLKASIGALGDADLTEISQLLVK